jgi:hypothetical protein
MATSRSATTTLADRGRGHRWRAALPRRLGGDDELEGQRRTQRVESSISRFRPPRQAGPARGAGVKACDPKPWRMLARTLSGDSQCCPAGREVYLRKLAKVSAACRCGPAADVQSDPVGLLRDDHAKFFSLRAPVRLVDDEVRRAVAACDFGPGWPSMVGFFTDSRNDVLRAHLESHYRVDARRNQAMRRYLDLPNPLPRCSPEVSTRRPSPSRDKGPGTLRKPSLSSCHRSWPKPVLPTSASTIS